MERKAFERAFASAIDNLKRAFGWTGDRPLRRPRRRAAVRRS